MSEKPQHTPEPWQVVRTGTRVEIMANGLLHPIAHVHHRGRSCGVNYRLPAEANAARIVQAVNSHDALVEACRFVKGFLNRLEDGSTEDDPLYVMRRKVHAPLHEKLDIALEAAKLQPPKIREKGAVGEKP